MEQAPARQPRTLQTGVIIGLLTLNLGGMVAVGVALGYTVSMANDNHSILVAHDTSLATNANLSKQCIATAALAARKAQVAATRSDVAAELARVRAR